MCPVKRTHVAAAAALVVLAVPTLTACFNGPAATTTVQATKVSGNGAKAALGGLHIDGAVIVVEDAAPNGTVTMRIANLGAEDDTLVGATVNGTPAYITNGSIPIPVNQSVSIGYQSDVWVNAYGLNVPMSSYVPVTLTFEKAGPVDLSLLTVPRAGYYADVAPNPATDPSPAPSPAAS